MKFVCVPGGFDWLCMHIMDVMGGFYELVLF